MAIADLRPLNLRRGLQLEYLTVGWNVLEGIIAVGAGLAAGSIALIGFGVDSFVETISGAVIIWRLMAETRAQHDDEAIEHGTSLEVTEVNLQITDVRLPGGSHAIRPPAARLT